MASARTNHKDSSCTYYNNHNLHNNITTASLDLEDALLVLSADADEKVKRRSNTTNCPTSTTSTPPPPTDANAHDEQEERQIPSPPSSPGANGLESVKPESGSSSGERAGNEPSPPAEAVVTSSTESSSPPAPVLAVKSKVPDSTSIPYTKSPPSASSPLDNPTKQENLTAPDSSSPHVLNGPSKSKYEPQLNHVVSNSPDSDTLAPNKIEIKSEPVEPNVEEGVVVARDEREEPTTSASVTNEPKEINTTDRASVSDDIMTVSKPNSSASSNVVNGQPPSSASPPLPSPNQPVTSSMLPTSNESVKIGLMNNNTFSDSDRIHTTTTIKTENEEMVNNSPTFVPTSTVASPSVSTGLAHDISSFPAPINGTINSSSGGTLNQSVLFNKGFAPGGVITSGSSNNNNNSLSNINLPSVGNNNPALAGGTSPVVQQQPSLNTVISSGNIGTFTPSSTMAPTASTLNFKPAPSGNITIGNTPVGNFVGTSGGISIGGGTPTPNAASQPTPTYIQTPTGLLLNRPLSVNTAGAGGLPTTPNANTPVIAHKSVVPRMVVNHPQVVGARRGFPGIPGNVDSSFESVTEFSDLLQPPVIIPEKKSNCDSILGANNESNFHLSQTQMDTDTECAKLQLPFESFDDPSSNPNTSPPHSQTQPSTSPDIESLTNSELNVEPGDSFSQGNISTNSYSGVGVGQNELNTSTSELPKMVTSNNDHVMKTPSLEEIESTKFEHSDIIIFPSSMNSEMQVQQSTSDSGAINQNSPNNFEIVSKSQKATSESREKTLTEAKSNSHTLKTPSRPSTELFTVMEPISGSELSSPRSITAIQNPNPISSLEICVQSNTSMNSYQQQQYHQSSSSLQQQSMHHASVISVGQTSPSSSVIVGGTRTQPSSAPHSAYSQQVPQSHQYYTQPSGLGQHQAYPLSPVFQQSTADTSPQRNQYNNQSIPSQPMQVQTRSPVSPHLAQERSRFTMDAHLHSQYMQYNQSHPMGSPQSSTSPMPSSSPERMQMQGMTSPTSPIVPRSPNDIRASFYPSQQQISPYDVHRSTGQSQPQQTRIIRPGFGQSLNYPGMMIVRRDSMPYSVQQQYRIAHQGGIRAVDVAATRSHFQPDGHLRSSTASIAPFRPSCAQVQDPLRTISPDISTRHGQRFPIHYPPQPRIQVEDVSPPGAQAQYFSPRPQQFQQGATSASYSSYTSSDLLRTSVEPNTRFMIPQDRDVQIRSTGNSSLQEAIRARNSSVFNTSQGQVIGVRPGAHQPMYAQAQGQYRNFRPPQQSQGYIPTNYAAAVPRSQFPSSSSSNRSSSHMLNSPGYSAQNINPMYRNPYPGGVVPRSNFDHFSYPPNTRPPSHQEYGTPSDQRGHTVNYGWNENAYFDPMRTQTPVTVQALSGLPPGAQGQHLLVRTQSGEYQLLRVGMPAPTPTTASGTPLPMTSSSPSTSVVTSALAQLATIHQQQQQIPSSPSLSIANSPSIPQSTMMSPMMTIPSTTSLTPRIATAISSSLRTPGVVISSSSTSIGNPSAPNPVLATSTLPYRPQTVPAVPNAASNSQSGVGMTASMSMQPSMHLSSQSHLQALPSQVPFSNANASSVNSAATANTVSQMTPDTAKTKCKNFLTFLLELSAKQNQTVAKNVKTLIQGLIDGRVSAEEFSERLQKEVNSQPQPCLVGFLKKSLPPLRHSLSSKELVIDGIRPPLASLPPTIPLPSTPVTALVPQAPTRPPVPTTPVRLVTPINSTPPVIPIPPSVMQTSGPTSTTPRSATTPQQRLPTPSKAASAKAAKAAGASNSPASGKGSSPSTPKGGKEKVDKKGFSSSSTAYGGDDDINDVAAMGGVNLAEESQKILGSTEMIGTQIRSCRDEIFFQPVPLLAKIKAKAAECGLEEGPSDVVAMISHATEERLKAILSKLAVNAEHRMDVLKMDDRYEVTQDVRGQLRFLEDLEKLERKRHDEQEREMLIKAAKSRSKSEDPEQAKLKAKAKEMQRVAMEELRQKEANLTALQAIGPRKKPKLDNVTPGIPSTPFPTPSTSFGAASSLNRPQLPLKPRLKRVNMRDLTFVFQNEKSMKRSQFLFKLLGLR